MSSLIYSFAVRTITGEPVTLDAWRDHVLLIVNVASRCGFTPQYQGLEALYRKYKDQRFVVLGFPCDQFGHQEPGTEAEIQEFCSLTYDVTFPMFSKIDVNGAHAHPLYQFLKSEKRGLLGSEAVKWNFTKFLVSRAGDVLARYGSAETPESIAPRIAEAIAEPLPPRSLSI
jgi:glutathione peroxidase